MAEPFIRLTPDETERAAAASFFKNPLWLAGGLLITAWGTVVTGPVAALVGFWFFLTAYIDARTYQLPDLLTLGGLVFALGFSSFYAGNPVFAFSGAAFGGGLFAAILLIFKKITGRDGMGWGDVKLMAMLGAWLGPFTLAPMLLIAAITALIFLAFRRLAGQGGLREPLPFGPFLLFAGWMCLLYPQVVWNAVMMLRLSL